MKGFVIFCLILFTATLSACGGNTTAVNGNSSSNQMEEDKKNETEENKQPDKKEEMIDKEEKEDEADKEKTALKPTYIVNQKNWLVQPINESINDKVVLLTIDDAPDKHALDMAKTLKQLNAGAIFFVNGHFLDTPEEKQTLKKIHSMGFMIGNHTYSHPFLPDLSHAEQKEEIIELNKLIEEIIGEKPQFFRAPNGANTPYTEQLVKEQGMTLMNWSYGYDYFQPYMNTEKLTEAMITGKAPEIDITYSLLKPGANLLMHDREWTANALHDIVVGLRAQGYEIVDPHRIKTK